MVRITIMLPKTICMRVTRKCNASCVFCLAPPDGIEISVRKLEKRLRWLQNHQVTTVHFGGGEPTIRSDLPRLITFAADIGLKSKLTTNGINLSNLLLKTLYANNIEVKISLHGDKEIHERLVGRKCFELVMKNIRRMLDAGINLAIQTVLVRSQPVPIHYFVSFCLENLVRKLCFIPVISRGLGNLNYRTLVFTPTEKAVLHQKVLELRDELHGRLDIGWLDLEERAYYVVETDGRIVQQLSTECDDITLTHITCSDFSKRTMNCKSYQTANALPDNWTFVGKNTVEEGITKPHEIASLRSQ